MTLRVDMYWTGRECERRTCAMAYFFRNVDVFRSHLARLVSTVHQTWPRRMSAAITKLAVNAVNGFNATDRTGTVAAQTCYGKIVGVQYVKTVVCMQREIKEPMAWRRCGVGEYGWHTWAARWRDVGEWGVHRIVRIEPEQCIALYATMWKKHGTSGCIATHVLPMGMAVMGKRRPLSKDVRYIQFKIPLARVQIVLLSEVEIGTGNRAI